ncbi:Helix-turn-helix domain-containing protein [Methylobacterium sp. 174MFSha1.1]|uniref:helix-turn-helix domain-containing protein n=1 Tax=Methylobacterium sp. 174MFSha1.1 TaxID=1502749 RepID=UPI0008F372E7|nr:helix-turn-helix transcriptional regulator [Methylobacterium sp. 174MFSha1.1]SFU65588.1 Helix-turn-helix domain-containing protein [Methylobacterium sp. 174MFSha1.1]
MSVQSIVTEGGEELVILSRRAYDALLARAGDEDAEDRMMARLAEDHLAARAASVVAFAPDWLTAAILSGESPLAAARRHAGLELADLAAKANVATEVLAAMEQGRHAGTPAVINDIAQACGIDAALLLDQDLAPVADEPAAPLPTKPRRRSAGNR